MIDAKTFAIQCHTAVNQRYHDKPYTFHLEMKLCDRMPCRCYGV